MGYADAGAPEKPENERVLQDWNDVQTIHSGKAGDPMSGSKERPPVQQAT